MWDRSRDRYPRGWEVIEIPSCGDLHRRSSPTLLPLHQLVSHDLKPCMQSSWMILGDVARREFFLFSTTFPNMIIIEAAAAHKRTGSGGRWSVRIQNRHAPCRRQAALGTALPIPPTELITAPPRWSKQIRARPPMPTRPS